MAGCWGQVAGYSSRASNNPCSYSETGPLALIGDDLNVQRFSELQSLGNCSGATQCAT